MSFKNYYAILGVAHNADLKTIKSAYRKLARQYHPDSAQHHEASDRFQEVDEAYGILRDPDKRAKYDQQLAALGSVFDRSSRRQKPLPQHRRRTTTEMIINVQVVWGAAGIILTILAGFVITELPEFRRMVNFYQDGVELNAYVFDVEHVPDEPSIVTMGYTVENVLYKDTFATGDSSYTFGTVVPIRYMPTNPSDFVRIDKMEQTLVGVIGGVVIIIVLPIIIGIGVLTLKYRRQPVEVDPLHAA